MLVFQAALFIASYHGHVRCVELLITAGAPVDEQNKVFYASSLNVFSIVLYGFR